jgi:hypothetical protein
VPPRRVERWRAGVRSAYRFDHDGTTWTARLLLLPCRSSTQPASVPAGLALLTLSRREGKRRATRSPCACRGTGRTGWRSFRAAGCSGSSWAVRWHRRGPRRCRPRPAPRRAGDAHGVDGVGTRSRAARTFPERRTRCAWPRAARGLAAGGARRGGGGPRALGRGSPGGEGAPPPPDDAFPGAQASLRAEVQQGWGKLPAATSLPAKKLPDLVVLALRGGPGGAGGARGRAGLGPASRRAAPRRPLAGRRAPSGAHGRAPRPGARRGRGLGRAARGRACAGRRRVPPGEGSRPRRCPGRGMDLRDQREPTPIGAGPQPPPPPSPSRRSRR